MEELEVSQYLKAKILKEEKFTEESSLPYATLHLKAITSF
jgi:hypothetical protein